MDKEIKNLYINILKHKVKYGIIPSDNYSTYLGAIIETDWGLNEVKIIRIYSERWRNEKR